MLRVLKTEIIGDFINGVVCRCKFRLGYFNRLVMNEMQGEKELLFVLNDNIADGLDVSWIWDINFSTFRNVTRVVTSGTRAYDIAVRIKCSGYDARNIVVRPDLDEAVAELNTTQGKKLRHRQLYRCTADSLRFTAVDCPSWRCCT